MITFNIKAGHTVRSTFTVHSRNVCPCVLGFAMAFLVLLGLAMALLVLLGLAMALLVLLGLAMALLVLLGLAMAFLVLLGQCLVPACTRAHPSLCPSQRRMQTERNRRGTERVGGGIVRTEEWLAWDTRCPSCRHPQRV